MVKKYFLEIKKHFSEDINFRLMLGLQFALIPTFSVLFAIILNYVVLTVTIFTLMSFDNARDFVIEDILFLFVEKSLLDIIPWFFVFFCSLLLVGIVLGKIILRPFKIIGDYCEAKINKQEASYDPEFMTNLKLLSSFSEWFFNTVNAMVEVGRVKDVKVPEKYKRIHKPVFETSFYIYNLFIVLIISTITAFLIFYTNQEVYNGVLEVITEFFMNKKEIKKFIFNLQDVYTVISVITIVFNVFSYLLFFTYIYTKISAPAFGIFATMRSFISGRYSTRVHLIGYPYVRNHTRSLNKYLDELEKNYVSKDI